jgi:hypothetical protein
MACPYKMSRDFQESEARNLALSIINTMRDSSSPAAPRSDRPEGFFRSLHEAEFVDWSCGSGPRGHGTHHADILLSAALSVRPAVTAPYEGRGVFQTNADLFGFCLICSFIAAVAEHLVLILSSSKPAFDTIAGSAYLGLYVCATRRRRCKRRCWCHMRG